MLDYPVLQIECLLCEGITSPVFLSCHSELQGFHTFGINVFYAKQRVHLNSLHAKHLISDFKRVRKEIFLFQIYQPYTQVAIK